MRIRRLSALFWATCIFAFIFILYVVTDLTFKLPNIRPAAENDKWTVFEEKLTDVEAQLRQHYELVGQIKKTVSQIVNNPPQPSKQQKKTFEEENAVIKEPPRQVAKKPGHVDAGNISKLLPEPDMSQCPFKRDVADNTMLSMYERITFDDIDGGAWKQGWNIEYDEKQWSRGAKLKVFVVPHSHNDPGWLKTFEKYYQTQTKAIFNNMVEKLEAVPGRKFIWCEVSYLSLWWTKDATDSQKATFKKLLKSGNIEIVTGGWVMNDEANSHWLSVVHQLTAGHQWLLDNLEYTPKNHWAIDPFGYSSTQPYILKLAGLENSVIQRVHYRIKKELALNRELEFKWRQLWDGVGKTDMFTHIMPFYAYDIPHTCGPDPKICCQFDFKRLPGNGVSCPWGVPPQKIVHKNVDGKAWLILDQWRKKAQLYRSNVVLVPLGDDFRYDSASEWDNQYQNYEALFDYINNKSEWNAEVQFGTLDDYFKALHGELALSEFPAVTGDFFTYADRSQHYWSGYYTSRPFHKRMDRTLLAYVRAAEVITARAVAAGAASRAEAVRLRARCEAARRALALFQHHDGITGTARTHVRDSYGAKMLEAIKYSQSAIQHAAYQLLGRPALAEQAQEDVFFHVDDVWQRQDQLPTRITITLDVVSPSRRVVLYNALNFARTDIVALVVSTPHVEVFDPSGSPVAAQVSPLVTGESKLGFAPNKYQLSFPAAVPPLGLATYTVALRDEAAINQHTSYARVRIYNADYWPVDLPKMFAVEMPTGRLEEDISLAAGNGTRVVCDKQGLLKAVTSGGETFPLAMDFVKYGSTKDPDNNSGAYLFIPSGPGAALQHVPYPEMVAVEGRYLAALHTALHTPKQAQLVLTIAVHNNPTLPQAEVRVGCALALDPAVDDLELAVRLSARVRNADTFYTDLNGMQMIKRRYFPKLPLQANFYPLPAAAYIQDARRRLTLLTSTPLGMAALAPGQIEVMLDRRLSRDDNRGLNQPIQDNLLTAHAFRLIVETADSTCQKEVSRHTYGQLSLGAHVSAQALLQPLVRMLYPAPRGAPPPPLPPPAPRSQADLVLAAFNAHVSSQAPDGKIMHGMGLSFHRVYLDPCFGNKEIAQHYPVGDGEVDLSQYVPGSPAAFDATLSFARAQPRASARLALCPMQARAVFLNHTPAAPAARH